MREIFYIKICLYKLNSINFAVNMCKKATTFYVVKLSTYKILTLLHISTITYAAFVRKFSSKFLIDVISTFEHVHLDFLPFLEIDCYFVYMFISILKPGVLRRRCL